MFVKLAEDILRRNKKDPKMYLLDRLYEEGVKGGITNSQWEAFIREQIL